MRFPHLRVPLGPADQPVARHSIRRRLIAVSAVTLSCAGAGVAYSPQAVAAPPTAVQMEAALFRMLNSERASMRLPTLRRNARLDNSAYAHNLLMARKNVMSHQVPGEISLAGRIHFYGYKWRAAAENVGWNSDMTVRGALHLEQLMYFQKAPNNGHRLNILGQTSRDLGIDVWIDRVHHKIWLTEDFGTPA